MICDDERTDRFLSLYILSLARAFDLTSAILDEMAIPWLAFVLAILVTRIVGQSSSVSPANWTSDDATRQIEGSVGMQIAVGDEVISLAPVLALTDGASNNLPVLQHSVRLE